jgi:glutamate-1-semialdehyde 2,1-aminomutase
VATFGIPGSAGVPDEIAQLTLALPYNDAQVAEAAFAAHQHEIACVIVEPVVGNAGCIPPAAGYLEALREISNREGALLIFDEVMTGFRVALGGAQELYGITPDLTTLGKILGGGLPCAAFGGRADIMDLLSPLGPVYQAGTLSGNPLAMAAGIATIGYLLEHRERVYPLLESLSEAVVSGIVAEASRANVPMLANRVGAMFTWFFSGVPIVDYDSAAKSDTAAFAHFHRAMLDQGVWLPCSQFEAAFLSSAHTMEDVRQTVDAARNALQSIAKDAPRR